MRNPRQSTILEFDYDSNITVLELKNRLFSLNANLQNITIYKSRCGPCDGTPEGIAAMGPILLADTTRLGDLYLNAEDFKWILLNYKHD
jgi:hypothetical protein